MTNRKDLIEPSDVERGEWLDVTRTYVEGLEDILDDQEEQLRIATEALGRIRRTCQKGGQSVGLRMTKMDNTARYAINKMKEKEQ